jgi:uncharacterized membrane protein HdeD (DUF308 family)
MAMTTAQDANHQPMAGELTGAWGAPLVIGALLIVGGVFALGASVATSVVSIYFLAGILLAVGVLEIVAASRLRDAAPFVVYFLAGVLTAVVGGMMLYRPIAGLGAVTLLIVGYLFTCGLFRGVTSIVDRYPQWGWDFAYAIITIMLGAYIVASWPISALWVLGTIVSAEIVARGITLVSAAWVLREMERGRTGDRAV